MIGFLLVVCNCFIMVIGYFFLMFNKFVFNIVVGCLLKFKYLVLYLNFVFLIICLIFISLFNG